MKATLPRLSELKTWDECYEVREAIENEPLHIDGGYKAWASGYETQLTAAAQRKVDAIQRKMDALEVDDE